MMSNDNFVPNNDFVQFCVQCYRNLNQSQPILDSNIARALSVFNKHFLAKIDGSVILSAEEFTGRPASDVCQVLRDLESARIIDVFNGSDPLWTRKRYRLSSAFLGLCCETPKASTEPEKNNEEEVIDPVIKTESTITKILVNEVEVTIDDARRFVEGFLYAYEKTDANMFSIGLLTLKRNQAMKAFNKLRRLPIF